MVCFYSIYLLIMYFNPRIEAWLYKVTNTTSPEYKSELHANGANGKNNGYSQVPDEERGESKLDKNKDDDNEEKVDDEKGTPEEEKGEQEKPKEEKPKTQVEQGLQGDHSRVFYKLAFQF